MQKPWWVQEIQGWINQGKRDMKWSVTTVDNFDKMPNQQYVVHMGILCYIPLPI